MTSHSSQRHAVVIGGGVIGAASAYFLMRAGWRVTIVELGKFGHGSSHGNCGLICPSHVLPLAEPGMVAQGIKSIFRRDSPFTIKPRIDRALWSWLFHFAARCNKRDMIEAGRGIQPLLLSSMALYQDLVKTELLDCEFETRGVLFAYRSRHAMESYAATDRLMAEVFHCPARQLDGDALLALEPALRPGLAGGWYYHDDAHLRPDKLMLAWRRVLEAGGTEIRENCAFWDFHARNRRAVAVETAQGAVVANAFVVAAGAWAPIFNQHLGCRLPIQSGKGYSLTMPRPTVCPKIPLIFPETRVAVTPFQSGYRLGSTMELGSYDQTIPPARLQLLKDGAAGYLQEPYCEPVVEKWFGWRPMTYDSLPIIDRSPKYENVIIAMGHNMLGVSMAPATGKLVVELIEETSPHINPKPYRVSRF